jgi:metal-responsive CopG/Arc/MetJ family transcriptional regulator
MTNITLSIPEDLHKKMKRHSEIRWSEVVRKALADKVSDLEYMEEISSKSRLTLREASEFSDKVSASASKKFMKLKKRSQNRCNGRF